MGPTPVSPGQDFHLCGPVALSLPGCCANRKWGTAAKYTGQTHLWLKQLRSTHWPLPGLQGPWPASCSSSPGPAQPSPAVTGAGTVPLVDKVDFGYQTTMKFRF